KDIICYLKILVNPSDDQSVKRVINVPKRGIGDTTVDKISTFAMGNGIDLYDALLNIEEIPGMARNVEKIGKFTELIEGFKAMLNPEEYSLVELYEEILDKTGYLEALKAEGTDEAKARMENLKELETKIVNYEENAEYPNLTELLEEIALVADVDEEADEDNPTAKVTLMTLHSAKGLEFPYVFIAGMEERLFPSGMSMDSDDPDAIEEERRLCYVGITRAMEKLYLSAAVTRTMYGNTNYTEDSRFIEEIPSHYLEREGREKYQSNKLSVSSGFGAGKTLGGYGSSLPSAMGGRGAVASRPKPVNYYSQSSNPSANPGFGKAFPMGNSASDDSYQVGDTVKHLKFGKGVVKSITPINGDKEVTVDFERVGEKTVFASLVKLKKL
ncbi:MAG: ATP-binding domain-containing protein, partial [Lachnospiraceae bacterium]|nr:ATP-binding domain-containing protein [Lachnospiraceae bacterium]